MRLHDMVQLPELDTYIGIVFVPGAGYRVGMVRDGVFSHMSPQAAWRMARENNANEVDLNEPTPLARALGLTAGKVRAMGLAGKEPDGRA